MYNGNVEIECNFYLFLSSTHYTAKSNSKIQILSAIRVPFSEGEMRFTDKVVVVTGAGSGIGKATAELFASEGAIVVAGDIDGARLEALSASLSSGGTRIVTVQGNIGKKEDAEKLIQTAVQEFGRLDILVNNAGIMDRFLPVGELTDEVWERVSLLT